MKSVIYLDIRLIYLKIFIVYKDIVHIVKRRIIYFHEFTNN